MALKGVPKSPEHKEKIRLSLLGRTQSAETREKRRLSLTGRPNTWGHKIGAALRGRPKSAEARRKMSLAKKGRPGHPLSKAHKLILASARTGKPLSPETIQKMRMAKLGKPGPWLGKKRTHVLSDSVRERLSKQMVGRPACFPMKRFYYQDIPFRSSYEVRVAKAFDALGIAWEYETKQFALTARKTYRPDFWLPDVGACWEVKGWFGPQSQEVVTLFRQRYGDVSLVVAALPVILELERAAYTRRVA